MRNLKSYSKVLESKPAGVSRLPPGCVEGSEETGLQQIMRSDAGTPPPPTGNVLGLTGSLASLSGLPFQILVIGIVSQSQAAEHTWPGVTSSHSCLLVCQANSLFSHVGSQVGSSSFLGREETCIFMITSYWLAADT